MGCASRSSLGSFVTYDPLNSPSSNHTYASGICVHARLWLFVKEMAWWPLWWLLCICLGSSSAQRLSFSSARQKTIYVSAVAIHSHQVQTCFMPSFLGCRKNEFLTANRTLLPLNNITAFALDPMYPLAGFVDESMTIWCSTFLGSNHVNITFTKPIVVEGITSRGVFDQGTRHFVSNFSVSSLDSDEELEQVSYLTVNSLLSLHPCVYFITENVFCSD